MVTLSDNMSELLAEVRAFEERVIGGLRSVVHETAVTGVEIARSLAPRRTGALVRDIRVRAVRVMERGAEVSFGTVKPYGLYVEAGTEPHAIRARRARALRWEDGDGAHFARTVRHPGTRAQPFMGPAYLATERALWARTEMLCSREIARAGGGGG